MIGEGSQMGRPKKFSVRRLASRRTAALRSASSCVWFQALVNPMGAGAESFFSVAVKTFLAAPFRSRHALLADFSAIVVGLPAATFAA